MKQRLSDRVLGYDRRNGWGSKRAQGKTSLRAADYETIEMP